MILLHVRITDFVGSSHGAFCLPMIVLVAFSLGQIGREMAEERESVSSLGYFSFLFSREEKGSLLIDKNFYSLPTLSKNKPYSRVEALPINEVD